MNILTFELKNTNFESSQHLFQPLTSSMCYYLELGLVYLKECDLKMQTIDVRCGNSALIKFLQTFLVNSIVLILCVEIKSPSRVEGRERTLRVERGDDQVSISPDNCSSKLDRYTTDDNYQDWVSKQSSFVEQGIGVIDPLQDNGNNSSGDYRKTFVHAKLSVWKFSLLKKTFCC